MALATVRNLLESSLLLARAVNKGEDPDADEYTDAFDSLIAMLGSWETESLIIPYVASSQYMTVAGQAEYAIGPTSTTWTGVRPGKIIDAWFQFDGLTLPLTQASFEQYGNIPVKMVTSNLLNLFMYNPSYPDGYFVLYPVPNIEAKVILSFDGGFGTWTLDTDITSLPPGYIQAIRYNLSLLLSDEYGKSPSATVAREAVRSKGVIKSLNLKAVDAVIDSNLPGVAQTGYNWRTDNA